MKKVQIYSSHMTKEQKVVLHELFPNQFDKNNISKDNFKLIITNNEPPEILYHYTSLKTLQQILERAEEEEKRNFNAEYSNSFVLRGTHIEFLNDLTEFILSIEILVELIRSYEDSLPEAENKHIASYLNQKHWKSFVTFYGHLTPPFITSFSENPDSLPMWNTYGVEGRGVAIGVKRRSINDMNYKSMNNIPSWVKCSYDSELIKAILSKAVGEIYTMFNINDNQLTFNGIPNTKNLSNYFSLLKDFSYEYEQEWRLVKYYSTLDIDKEIKFHEKDGLLKPYVEHLLPHNILKEVILGPCSEMDISKKSLEMSLERAGYSISPKDKGNDNFVEIKFSRIPYRRI